MSNKPKDESSEYTKIVFVFTGPENLNKVIGEHIVRKDSIRNGKGVWLASYESNKSQQPRKPDLN